MFKVNDKVLDVNHNVKGTVVAINKYSKVYPVSVLFNNCNDTIEFTAEGCISKYLKEKDIIKLGM